MIKNGTNRRKGKLETVKKEQGQGTDMGLRKITKRFQKSLTEHVCI